MLNIKQILTEAKEQDIDYKICVGVETHEGLNIQFIPKDGRGRNVGAIALGNTLRVIDHTSFKKEPTEDDIDQKDNPNTEEKAPSLIKGIMGAFTK